MESIEQPIFNPYGSDDKDELIDDAKGSNNKHKSNSNSTTDGDVSPTQAAKGLLASGKEELADHGRGLWIIVICTVVFSIIITIALILTIYLMPKQISGHAAVVTEVEECSVIGLDMMRKGGNAVDAAVAAAFCLGVVHPHSSGLGGGGFLLYHDHKTEKSVSYNFRETAPAKATETMLNGIPEVDWSALSVAVPGQLKGLADVHNEWGSLDWATVLQPSIDLARNGFNVTQNLADSLSMHADMAKIPVTSNFIKYFVINGEYAKYGDIISRPDLALAMEQIKNKGADAFYHGELGENFVQMVHNAGGIMEMSDLAAYSVAKHKPIISTFKGKKVVNAPAPSSGPVVALMLKMIEGFNWTETSHKVPQTYQEMIETFKFGFGHRSLLGDPANPVFTEAISNATNDFISEKFAAKLRAKVDNSSHSTSYYGPRLSPTLNKGTAHISVIDSNEVMVSLTMTNNFWFGNKMMSDDGILANNQMLDFSFTGNAFGSMPLNEKNLIVPGMRPLSSMSPTIVYSEEHPCSKRLVVGASNGTRIITGVVQTIVNAVMFDMDIKKAVSYPRVHQQLYPNDTYYEDIKSQAAPDGRCTFPADIVQALEGPQVMRPASQGLSCVQAIMKINDAVSAYSDWRKGGQAAQF